LLRQIFSSDSILQIVQPRAVLPLQRYANQEPNSNRDVAVRIPAIGMVIRNINVSTNEELKRIVDEPLRRLAGALALRSQQAFEEMKKQREVSIAKDLDHDSDDSPAWREWETTGSYYGRPPIRRRPFYEGRDGEQDGTQAAAEARRQNQLCQKYYETYKKQSLTGGLMAIWCPHLVCLGFHKMPRSEGRDDVFSAIFTHWEKAPEVVIYDFACQLAPYCLVREPEYFRDTLFVIDEMHANGHSNCSQACFLSNYMHTTSDLLHINSNAAECSNSGLSRIRKTISYMNEKHAILYTHVYVSVWNRLRILGFQDDAAKRVDELGRGRYMPHHVDGSLYEMEEI
jgi:Kyakuja-Dileera-Zisupton transposase